MTNGTASGKGAPTTGAPRPNSCEAAAVKALTAFAFEERLMGAAKAHEGFDAILTETITQLELVSIDLNLREYTRAGDVLRKHLDHLRSLRSHDE